MFTNIKLRNFKAWGDSLAEDGVGLAKISFDKEDEAIVVFTKMVAG